MKVKQSIIYLLVGAFVLAPLSVLAEDTGVTTTESVSPSGTAAPRPVPTLYRENERPGVKGAPVRMMEKVATGTRMLATSSRPLPALIEKRIENREENMAQRADCVTKNGVVSSTTDCIGARALQRKEDVRERVAERKGDVLRALSNLLIKRLNAAIGRETILANRIDSRIAKLQSQNVVTTDAEMKIGVARTKIAAAKDAVALATTKIEEAVSVANMASSTATRGDAGKYVREEMNTAKESLMEAHKALVDAVSALKANKKATTTPEAASSSSAE